MSTDTPEALPLGTIALEMLVQQEGADEAFGLNPKGPAVMQAAVEALFTSGVSHEAMRGRVREVLSLCYVLETREGSPRTARVLADTLLSEPRVRQLLRPPDDTARAENYRQFVDAADPKRAPSLNAKAPEDSLKLASFLTPGQELRQRRPPRTEAGAEPAPSRPSKPTPKSEGPLSKQEAQPSEAADTSASKALEEAPLRRRTAARSLIHPGQAVPPPPPRRR